MGHVAPLQPLRRDHAGEADDVIVIESDTDQEDEDEEEEGEEMGDGLVSREGDVEEEEEEEEEEEDDDEDDEEDETRGSEVNNKNFIYKHGSLTLDIIWMIIIWLHQYKMVVLHNLST